jgi:two-component system sensor histidine kinase GlrK
MKIRNLSIKTIALLGFVLVALPLVMALLYSAMQVSLLSSQGANAIFDVAQLIKTNRELSKTMTNMERYAGQYIVLKDQELLQQYRNQQHNFQKIINKELSKYYDHQLVNLINKASTIATQVEKLLTEKTVTANGLEQVQNNFKELANTSQLINIRSNDLISEQADNIKKSADKVSTMLVNSLIIIPMIIIIAAIFVGLISKPLRRLTEQIKTLESGKFTQPIVSNGSSEVLEIADALEMMRTRLQALELQKTSFIRHISHELKTPLAAIRVGIELLSDSSVGQLNNEQQEVCNIIRNSVNRLQQLIEDLLDFNIVLDSTSLQNGEPIMLTSLINKVLAERQLDLKHKEITLIQELGDISLVCNNKQLEVIVDNLLSNAIKFSPEKGTITINAQLDNEDIYLKISDQGKGISPEVQAKIFEAFYQGEAPVNSQIKSSGLGLTIVKELIMRLNGEIMVESSTTQPHGTTFIVKLPQHFRQGLANEG